jgi:hypothetical protein
MMEIMPDTMVRFLRKNEDYKSNSDQFGPKAQIIDVARKFGKIKAVVWDGETLDSEPLEEVIDDMVAHLFLLKEALAYEGTSGEGLSPLNFDALAWRTGYDKTIDEILRLDGGING